MSVKCTTDLTRKEAEDLFYKNILQIREAELKENLKGLFLIIPDNFLENMLEKQAVELGDEFTNYNIIPNKKEE